MRQSVRLALAALAASLLLAATLSAASARSFRGTNQNFRVTWASLEFVSGETAIRCPVTLEGSYHQRTIAKIQSFLLAAITRGTSRQASCTGGIIALFNGTEAYNGTTTPNTLPWHKVYVGFSGTLPRFTLLSDAIERVRFGIRDAAGFCTGQYGVAGDRLYANTTIEAGGAMTTRAFVEGFNELTLFRTDGGFFCPGVVRVRGTGAVTVQGSATRITLTLI